MASETEAAMFYELQELGFIGPEIASTGLHRSLTRIPENLANRRGLWGRMRKLNHSQLLPRALVVISMQMATDALAETAMLPLHQRAAALFLATAWWSPTSARIARNASFVP